MKICSCLVLCALVSAPLQSQAPTDTQILDAAFEVMRSARYCTLITIGEDGHPQARIVDPLISRAEGRVWIATNPATRKVKEIARDPRVTLNFFHAAANEYVTILGRATPITDATQRAKRWKPEWAPFYEQQHSGSDFLLFEVRPSRFEVDSRRQGILSDPQSWRPVILDVK
jgi:general stress protein 26